MSARSEGRGGIGRRPRARSPEAFAPAPPPGRFPEERETAAPLATEAAETGVARVIEEAWTVFRNAPPGRYAEEMLGLDGSGGAAGKLSHRGCAHGRASYDAEVFSVDRVGPDEVDVRIRALGRKGEARKTIVCVLRFGLGTASVFDHAYFVDGDVRLSGRGLTIHGDVAANGDLECRDVLVNGDLRAARNPAIGSLGRITGVARSDPLSAYRSGAGGRARPSNPTAEPQADVDVRLAPSLAFPTGYDGESRREEKQPPIALPHLEDLGPYEALAADRGGAILSDGVIITAGGRYEGTLHLEGTPESPIQIRGPVVVEGDVIIRGVVRGQGTIYAERNIHVVGDIRYETPPVWPKPSAWPGEDENGNRTADALGLAARRNIVIGDYTTPRFRGSVIRSLDSSRVTRHDGGTKSDGSPRRHHESSLADPAFHALAGEKVRRIDAVMYADGTVLGELGPGQARINGGIAAREEAIVFDGELIVSHDVRVHSGAFREIPMFLPRGPNRQLLLWQESNDEAATAGMAGMAC